MRRGESNIDKSVIEWGNHLNRDLWETQEKDYRCSRRRPKEYGKRHVERNGA